MYLILVLLEVYCNNLILLDTVNGNSRQMVEVVSSSGSSRMYVLIQFVAIAIY